MAQDASILLNSQTRVYTIEGGSGPGSTPLYQGRARATTAAHQGGGFTPVRNPSRTSYGSFDTIAKIRAQAGLPTVTLEMREQRRVSPMLTLFQKRCEVDIQIHAGACTDPADFNSYEFARILEGAGIENWGVDDQGTFEAEAVVTETLPFVGDELYDVEPMRDTPIGSATILQEIVGVSICDSVSCGQCGAPSDGASVVFAVTKSHGGSPGLPGEVIYTANGGSTVGSTIVDTLPANHDASDLSCVGTRLAVISGEDLSIHYAPIQDILLGTEAWAKVTTGLVAAKLPNRIFSLGASFTWIAAAGGYIYFASDITAGVAVQTAGAITVQNLVDIHGIDELNLIAVGASNTVLVTSDGGSVWASVVGPAIGVDLTSCWMRSTREWLIGDAGGNLWYTRDGGLSWTNKAFTGSGSGTVQAIAFATRSVGFMTHTLSSRGWLLRTIDGGASWARIPDGGNTATLTDNDKLSRLAVAVSAPANIRANVVWAGGLGADALDGILLKVAA